MIQSAITPIRSAKSAENTMSDRIRVNTAAPLAIACATFEAISMTGFYHNCAKKNREEGGDKKSAPLSGERSLALADVDLYRVK